MVYEDGQNNQECISGHFLGSNPIRGFGTHPEKRSCVVACPAFTWMQNVCGSRICPWMEVEDRESTDQEAFTRLRFFFLHQRVMFEQDLYLTTKLTLDWTEGSAQWNGRKCQIKNNYRVDIQHVWGALCVHTRASLISSMIECALLMQWESQMQVRSTSHQSKGQELSKMPGVFPAHPKPLSVKYKMVRLF